MKEGFLCYNSIPLSYEIIYQNLYKKPALIMKGYEVEWISYTINRTKLFHSQAESRRIFISIKNLLFW